MLPIARLAFFFFLSAPTLVWAQTANYQNRLLGQRALGMGGAFAGIADDPSASYYNPAALSNLSVLQLEVGLPVLGFDLHRVFGGLVPAPAQPMDVSALQVVALPTMVGAAAAVGPKDGDGREYVTLAVSLLIPWLRNVAWKQTVQTDPTSAFHLVQETEQTTLIGGSMSFRLGPISIGASLYYMHANVLWLNARSGTTSTCTESGCELQSSYNLTNLMETWFGALNPRFGVLVKISPQVSLGLMASLSSYRLFGTGSMRTGIYSVSSNGAPVQTSYQSDGLVFNRPLPWELKVGVGYQPTPKLTFALDGTLYIPDRFTMIAGVDQRFSIFPAEVRRLPIGNGNFGVEYYVMPAVPLRLGVFTNLSAAPPVALDPSRPGQSRLLRTSGCDVEACSTWMHEGGVTASVGFTIWRVALDVGITASYGRGYRQQIVDAANKTYRWSDTDHFFAQFVVGGNLGKVLGETAEGLKHEIERRRAASENNGAPADSGSLLAPSPK